MKSKVAVKVADTRRDDYCFQNDNHLDQQK